MLRSLGQTDLERLKAQITGYVKPVVQGGLQESGSLRAQLLATSFLLAEHHRFDDSGIGTTPPQAVLAKNSGRRPGT